MSDFGKYRNLILFLQENPLANKNEIAKELNLTLPTIRKYLTDLHNPQSDSVIIGTHGNVNFNKLGLETSNFLIDFDSGRKNIDQLFKLADFHPYTFFQNRCYGAFNGFFIQFAHPIGKASVIQEMFEDISENANINEIIKLGGYGQKYISTINFNFWKENRWDFNVDDWLNGGIRSNKPKSSTGVQQDNIDLKLSKSHIIALRELTIDARRKQSQIMDDIQNSQYYDKKEKSPFSNSNQRNVSRYFNHITDSQLISSYQILFNRRKLNIYNQIILFGKMNTSNQEILKTAYKINSSNNPFSTILSFKNDSFLWILNLPHEQMTEFIRIGYDLSSEFNMIILDDNIKYQRNYPIWHRNFVEDETGSYWRDDYDWLVSEPIRAVFKERK